MHKVIENPSRTSVAFFGVGCTFLGLLAGNLRADDTWDDHLPAEASGHLSFVRAYDNSIAFEDWRFSNKIYNAVNVDHRWKSVDIVMQQCFGGGFANDMATQAPTPYTLTTASAWNEIAWNLQEAPNAPVGLANFTSEWIYHARETNLVGMRSIAANARRTDSLGPVRTDTTHTATEHPTYSSADATPGGVNDERILDDFDGLRVYGVIAAFGRADALANRHKVNEQRVYSLFSNRFGAARVASLYGNSAGQTFAGGTTYRFDPDPLPAMPVSGTSTRADIYKAIDGGFYSGYTKGSNDQLVIYTTGHGGHAQFSQFGYQALDTHTDGTPDGARFEIPLPTEYGMQQRESGQPFPTFNPRMYGDTDETTDMAEIQIHLSRPINFDPNLPNAPKLVINGFDVTIDPLDMIVPLAFVRDLPIENEDAEDESTAFVYQVDVSVYALLGSSPNPLLTTIDITNIDNYYSDERLIRGVSIWSGDNEFVAVNVPEPIGAGMVGMVGVLLMRRRLAK